MAIWLALFSTFRAAILDAWRNKVSVDLCGRQGFRGRPLLDLPGSLQLLSSSHVRDRDKGFASEYSGWGCLEWFFAE